MSSPLPTKSPVRWKFSRSSSFPTCFLGSKRCRRPAGEGWSLGGPDSCCLLRSGKGTGTHYLPLVCAREAKTAVHPLISNRVCRERRSIPLEYLHAPRYARLQVCMHTGTLTATRTVTLQSPPPPPIRAGSARGTASRTQLSYPIGETVTAPGSPNTNSCTFSF